MKNFKTTLILMVSFLIFHSAAIAQIDQTKIQNLLEKNFPADQPGVTLLVAKDGNIIFKGASGMANLELNIPMKVDHVLRIGSITKQFTAVAILMLQEQSKLNIQDDITKFIPDYPTNGKKITVEHLLTHTSGIQSYTEIPGFMANHLRGDKTVEEMMDFFKNNPMSFSPGEKFQYNNSGYFLLGVIIEKVSGMTYGDFVEQNIFQKIGMKNSFYDSENKVIPNRVSGYEMDGGQIINAPYLSSTIPYAAGSLISTVEDLYKWNQAIHNYTLIKKESLEKALTPFTLNDGESTEYGYGWGIKNFFNEKSFQHSGGINGFVSNAMYLPEQNLFVAAFSNGKGPQFLTDIVAAQILEKYPEVKKKSLTKEQMAEYVGIYKVENATNHQRTIQIKDDHLTSLRTGGDRHNLYAFEKDKFYFEHTLEIFEFKRDKNGKVLGMLAHLPNGKKGRAIKSDEKPIQRKEVQLDEKILQQYVGKYEVEPGFFLVFTIEKGKFWIAPTGDKKLRVFAEGDHKFFLKDADAFLEFVQEENNFKTVKVNLGGQKIIGKKI
ncbi:MAG: serine hydrolase [Saprospiraceae bacterium]